MRLRSIQNPLCILLLLCLILTACAAPAERAPTSEPGPEPIEDTTPEISEPETSFLPGDVALYDGVFRTLANGDSFYTPGSGHSVTDPHSTVLYYNNLLLVFTDTDPEPEEMDALADSVGGEAIGQIRGGIHAFQILVDDHTLAELEALSQTLMRQDPVLYACPEYPVQIMGTASDQNPWDPDGTEESLGNEESPDGLDWWAEAIGAYTAWEYADQCREIWVGIADNGFYSEHEDLQGQITFVTNDNCNTAADHGTMVAGIIGAVNNDIGIRGIADSAVLCCADLWPEDEYNSYHTLAEYLAVIQIMAQNGVRVVNNSWGCYLPSEESWSESFENYDGDYAQWLEQRLNHDLVPTAEFTVVMISQLVSSGYDRMLFVQAAGNGIDNGGWGADARYTGFFATVTEDIFDSMAPSLRQKLAASGISYSLIDERILIVGAVQNTRDAAGNYQLAYFSNIGPTVDLCAPGMTVFSTMPSDFGYDYGAASGTSPSAPMVTGSAAYLWSLDPELTVAEVRQLLLDSAAVLAIGTGSSEGWSYPMLNLGAAVRALMETSP